jgi:hypothetical protein
MTGQAPFGIAGVFAEPDGARSAARQLQDLGFDAVEAYTPYPVEGLVDLLHSRRRIALPLLIFAAAVLGVGWGYFAQYWGEALDYPINVGGRPYASWPAFTVVAFEMAVLFAIAAAFFGLLASCRLPLLYHPMFEAPEFERASRDRFVLCVEARDPGFEPNLIRRVFERNGAERVEEVAGWR